MSEYINETGERLATLRKEKKMTQKEVAERLGVNETTVNAWEVGKAKKSYKIGQKSQEKKEPYDISSTNLKALADLYGVSCDYILGRTPFRSVGGEDIARLTGLTDTVIQTLQENNASEEPDPVAFVISLLCDDLRTTGQGGLVYLISEYVTAWAGTVVQDADAGHSLPSFVPDADAINDLAWTFHRAGIALNRLRNEYLKKVSD